MFLLAVIAPAAHRRSGSQRSSGRTRPIAVQPWSYWKHRYPRAAKAGLLQTSYQQPGHKYRPVGRIPHGELVWHP